VGHLELVELLQPGTEPFETGGFAGACEGADLLDHGVPVTPHPQLASVREAGAVHRVERAERHMVLERRTGGGERLLEQARHRQHRRSRVDAEPRLLDDARAPAGSRVTFEDDDVVTAAGEMARSRETAQTGAHHDRPHGAVPRC
jgi:hypothetical protein